MAPIGLRSSFRFRAVRGRRAILAAAASLLALGAGGCGEDGGPAEGGEAAPIESGGDPGPGAAAVPPGAPYNVDGRGWIKLQQVGQFQAATAYVADNSESCQGAEVGAVALFVTSAYGGGRPLDTPAAEILAEGCDAAGSS
jgi:hypothetical protein